jgi:hypothetical protein
MSRSESMRHRATAASQAIREFGILQRGSVRFMGYSSLLNRWSALGRVQQGKEGLCVLQGPTYLRVQFGDVEVQGRGCLGGEGIQSLLGASLRFS